MAPAISVVETNREISGLDHLVETTNKHPSIRALEIKLSQGAKPGLGGILPASKITPEISRIRGIPMGVDCISPSSHSAFSDADSLLDFVENIAEETRGSGGDQVRRRGNGSLAQPGPTERQHGTGVDFITIDGGEGGTGAGPLVFTDRVALPFKMGMSRVYGSSPREDCTRRSFSRDRPNWVSPEMTLFAFAWAATWSVWPARQCFRSADPGPAVPQRPLPHRRRHPKPGWLVRGLDPLLKADRLANYVMTLRKEVLTLSRACGVVHPALITSEYLRSSTGVSVRPPCRNCSDTNQLRDAVPEDRAQITELMNGGPGGTATG
ncbi:MAG: hypothetical protein CM1200mP2_30770 [Planctomycetaceae bacterium]|nr:MAG: hypothetical protein CM1200mP2_30770 [Planctomycetaceae bacterium]